MAKQIMAADDSASVRQMVSFTLKQGGKPHGRWRWGRLFSLPETGD